MSVKRSMLHRREILKHSRQKKQKRRLIKVAWWAGGVVAVFLIAVGLTHYRPLQFQEVEVRGNRVVSSDEVRAAVDEAFAKKYWGIFSRRNILLYPKQELYAALARRFPNISQLEIDSLDLTSLAINITERRGRYVWCNVASPMDCYFADESGFLFSPAPQFGSGVYFQINGRSNDPALGTRPLATDSFQRLIEYQEKLNKILQNSVLKDREVYQVTEDGEGDYRFLAKERNAAETTSLAIIINLSQDQEELLERLKTALGAEALIADLEERELELDYIDLRFGAKVFYKFR